MEALLDRAVTLGLRAQGFSFNQPGQQYGSAVVVGEGLVIEVIYVVDPWSGHGNGVGRDSKGGTYRLQF